MIKQFFLHFYTQILNALRKIQDFQNFKDSK